MTLIDFRITCQVLCRMSYGDLSDVYLMISLGLWVDGRKIAKVKCHSHQIISKVYTSNMTHYHCCWVWSSPAEVVLIRFYFKATLFFLFFVLCCLEGSRYSQPTLKEWRVMLYHIEQSYLYNLFRIKLHGRFVYCLRFIYLFNTLFISV